MEDPYEFKNCAVPKPKKERKKCLSKANLKNARCVMYIENESVTAPGKKTMQRSEVSVASVIESHNAYLKVQYPFLTPSQIKGRALKYIGLPNCMGEISRPIPVNSKAKKGAPRRTEPNLSINPLAITDYSMLIRNFVQKSHISNHPPMNQPNQVVPVNISHGSTHQQQTKSADLNSDFHISECSSDDVIFRKPEPPRASIKKSNLSISKKQTKKPCVLQAKQTSRTNDQTLPLSVEKHVTQDYSYKICGEVTFNSAAYQHQDTNYEVGLFKSPIVNVCNEHDDSDIGIKQFDNISIKKKPPSENEENLSIRRKTLIGNDTSTKIDGVFLTKSKKNQKKSCGTMASLRPNTPVPPALLTSSSFEDTFTKSPIIRNSKAKARYESVFSQKQHEKHGNNTEKGFLRCNTPPLNLVEQADEDHASDGINSPINNSPAVSQKSEDGELCQSYRKKATGTDNSDASDSKMKQNLENFLPAPILQSPQGTSDYENDSNNATENVENNFALSDQEMEDAEEGENFENFSPTLAVGYSPRGTSDYETGSSCKVTENGDQDLSDEEVPHKNDLLAELQTQKGGDEYETNSEAGSDKISENAEEDHEMEKYKNEARKSNENYLKVLAALQNQRRGGQNQSETDSETESEAESVKMTIHASGQDLFAQEAIEEYSTTAKKNNEYFLKALVEQQNQKGNYESDTEVTMTEIFDADSIISDGQEIQDTAAAADDAAPDNVTMELPSEKKSDSDTYNSKPNNENTEISDDSDSDGSIPVYLNLSRVSNSKKPVDEGASDEDYCENVTPMSNNIIENDIIEDETVSTEDQQEWRNQSILTPIQNQPKINKKINTQANKISPTRDITQLSKNTTNMLPVQSLTDRKKENISQEPISEADDNEKVFTKLKHQSSVRKHLLSLKKRQTVFPENTPRAADSSVEVFTQGKHPSSIGRKLPTTDEQMISPETISDSDNEEVFTQGKNPPSIGRKLLPPTDEQIIFTETTSDSDNEEVFTQGKHQPSIGRKLPPTDEQMISPENVSDSDNKEVFTQGKHPPSIGRKLPATDEQMISPENVSDSDNEEMFTQGKHPPSIGRKLPPTDEQMISPENVSDSDNEEMFTQGKHPPSIGRKLPPTDKQIIFTETISDSDNEEVFTQGKHPPSIGRKLPPTDEQMISPENVSDSDDEEVFTQGKHPPSIGRKLPPTEEQMISPENVSDSDNEEMFTQGKHPPSIGRKLPPTEEQMISPENVSDSDDEEVFTQGKHPPSIGRKLPPTDEQMISPETISDSDNEEVVTQGKHPPSIGHQSVGKILTYQQMLSDPRTPLSKMTPCALKKMKIQKFGFRIPITPGNMLGDKYSKKNCKGRKNTPKAAFKRKLYSKKKQQSNCSDDSDKESVGTCSESIRSSLNSLLFSSGKKRRARTSSSESDGSQKSISPSNVSAISSCVNMDVINSDLSDIEELNVLDAASNPSNNSSSQFSRVKSAPFKQRKRKNDEMYVPEKSDSEQEFQVNNKKQKFDNGIASCSSEESAIKFHKPLSIKRPSCELNLPGADANMKVSNYLYGSSSQESSEQGYRNLEEKKKPARSCSSTLCKSSVVSFAVNCFPGTDEEDVTTSIVTNTMDGELSQDDEAIPRSTPW